jgi:hypothetical protein
VNLRLPATLTKPDGGAVVQLSLLEDVGIVIRCQRDGERQSYLYGPSRALSYAADLISAGWILSEHEAP